MSRAMQGIEFFSVKIQCAVKILELTPTIRYCIVIKCDVGVSRYLGQVVFCQARTDR
jgi:hypothetical protein